MAEKFVQKLFDFSEPGPESIPAHAARYQTGPEAVEAIDRLETWLFDPRTGETTEIARDILSACRKALIEGKNAWWHAAEDGLEAMLLSPSIGLPEIRAVEEKAFRQTVEDALDCLHERLVRRER